MIFLVYLGRRSALEPLATLWETQASSERLRHGGSHSEDVPVISWLKKLMATAFAYGRLSGPNMSRKILTYPSFFEYVSSRTRWMACMVRLRSAKGIATPVHSVFFMRAVSLSWQLQVGQRYLSEKGPSCVPS